MTEKANIAAWIKSNLASRNISQRKVALAIGVAVSTVSRWCDPDDPTIPTWKNITALADAFGEPPPGGSPAGEMSAGLAEHGLEAIAEGPLGDDWNGNISEWRVKDATMQTKGYMIGDTVKADARLQPVDGDVVVANLYDTQGRARTVLRVFKAPGYLVPATADADSLEVHEVGKTAAVFGVVFESTRRRAPH